MELVYQGPHDEVEFLVDSEIVTAKRGFAVEVPDDTALALLAQGRPLAPSGDGFAPDFGAELDAEHVASSVPWAKAPARSRSRKETTEDTTGGES